MSRKRRKAKTRSDTQSNPKIGYVLGTVFDDLVCSEYVSLDQCPEIVSGIKAIADLIGSMTIHLMANTASGDVRIQNELSRVIDINPEKNMTRMQWMSFIVSTLLLYGKGNAVVMPHTWSGLLQSCAVRIWYILQHLYCQLQSVHFHLPFSSTVDMLEVD